MNAVVQSLKDFGAAKLAAMAGVGLLLIVFFGYLLTTAATPTMMPLYTGLSLEDSHQIVAELDKKQVPYRIEAGGSQILVAADQIAKVRVQIAGQAMPSSGSIIGYEVFDKNDTLGTSSFVNNINYLRALEGELGRTINAFDGISKARVHLVIPKRELFNRNQAMPTASVALALTGKKKLAREEVNAIRHLVATAVPGLEPSHITIVDNNGRLLARGGTDENDPEMMAADAQDYRDSVEKRLKNTVEQLLEESLGVGKIRAEISADVNFDQIETTSEIYDPESKVIRSVQTTDEKENSSEKTKQENTSVQNNLPDAKQSDNSNALTASNTQRNDETTNYEISKKVEKHIQGVGSIKHLSVAALIDGTYTVDDKGVRQYVPRTEEELKHIETLVKSAVGFDEKRGDSVEVVNMQFVSAMEEEAKESTLDFIKRDFNNILETVLFGVVAVLAILLVVRPLVRHILEASAVAHGSDDGITGHEALAGPSIAGHLTDQSGMRMGVLPDGTIGQVSKEEGELMDVAQIRGKVKFSSVKQIQKLIEEHPEETVAALRQWMTQG